MSNLGNMLPTELEASSILRNLRKNFLKLNVKYISTIENFGALNAHAQKFVHFEIKLPMARWS